MLKVGPLRDEWLGGIPSTDKKDPRPFLLAGVRVKFAPIARPAVRRGRSASFKVRATEGTDIEEAGDAYSMELLRDGIVEWEGVVDRDTEEPLPVTPEIVELVLRDPDFFAAADRAYVLPYALRSAEKNGLSVSPAGTGEAGTVARATARRPAGSKTANAVKRAPTPNMRSKARKPKTSGTS